MTTTKTSVASESGTEAGAASVVSQNGGMKALRIVPGFELKLRETVTVANAGATIQFWIRLDPASVAGRILFMAPDKDSHGLIIEQTEFMGLRVQYMGRDGQEHFFQVFNVLPAQGFAHISLSFSAKGEIQIYKNGQLMARAVGEPIAAQTLAYNRLSRKGGQGQAFKREVPPARKFTAEDVEHFRARGALLQREARFSGAIADLRIWGRALSSTAIEKNWCYTKFSKTQLLLYMPLNGVAPTLDGHVQWEDAPGLVLKAAPPPPRASIRGRATLLSSTQVAQENNPVDLKQMEGEKLPELFAPKVNLPRFRVTLTAQDERGRRLPKQIIAVSVDRDTAYIRYDGGKPVMQFALKGTGFVLTTGFDGEVSFDLPMEKLMTPLLKMRHQGMPTGEYSFFSPDREIFETFASITAQELANGRISTADSAGGQGSLIQSDAENMADILHAAMGAALHFSHGEGVPGSSTPQLVSVETVPDIAGTTAALAEPPGQLKLRRHLEALPDAHAKNTFVVPEGREIRRYVGSVMRKAFAGPLVSSTSDAPMAFEDVGGAIADAGETVWNWIFGKSPEELFGDLVDYVNEEGDALIGELGGMVGEGLRVLSESVDGVVGTVVSAGKMMVNTVVNGVKVAGAWIAETVEDAVNIVQKVFEVIGKAISEVIDWLASLFAWGDFLATSDGLLSLTQEMLDIVREKGTTLFDKLADSVDTLEDTLLGALGGENTQQLNSAKGEEPDEPEPIKALEYLMDMLKPRLPDIDIDFGFLAPLEDVAGSLDDKVADIFGIVKTEAANSGITEVFADPEKISTMAGDLLLNFLRTCVKVLMGVVKKAIELGRDVLVAVVDVLRNVFKVHISIPVLTPFVEKVVLGGRQLTIGRLLCFLAAIPATVIYKLVTGSDHGPLTSDGVMSFADSGPDPARAYSYEVVKRIFEGFGFALIAILDFASTFGESVKVIDVVLGIADVLINVAVSCPLLEFAWSGTFEKPTAVQVLQILAWLLTVLAAATPLIRHAWVQRFQRIFRITSRDLKFLGGIKGLPGGIAALINDIAGLVYVAVDSESIPGDKARATFDMFKDAGLLTTAVIKAAELKDEVSMAVFGGAYVVSHASAFAAMIAIFADGPKKLASPDQPATATATP